MNIPTVRTKHDNFIAAPPKYATSGSAGADLFVAEETVWEPGEMKMVPTCISVAIPDGYVGLVFARSSLFKKTGLMLANSVGVIDSDYRGEIYLPLVNMNADETITLRAPSKVAQIVLVKCEQAYFDVVDSLDETERGSGGFGSTDDPVQLPLEYPE